MAVVQNPTCCERELNVREVAGKCKGLSAFLEVRCENTNCPESALSFAHTPRGTASARDQGVCVGSCGMSKGVEDMGGPRGGGKGSTTKIFVGGLPATVTETDLHAFFSEYGKVTEVLIMYDQEQRRSRGFGFVSFETEDAVNQLTGRRYVEISGKQVECKRAEPKESRMANKGGRPGGGGGWGGQQQQQWGWGSSNGAGSNMNSGYQGYGGYNNSWGNNQSSYGYGGAGDQSYSGYGSYGQQQPSSYGPMRTSYSEGYTATPAATGGYNAPSTNGMAAAAPVGQTDGSYHPYRR
ncbi:hypothetical protein HPB51_010143 [Rhipicephalus microplus]|uniref:RRM domain-containing protein n=1 Tax=Rhipicephalus microplus TaxID=6941 RepID=A0A9J6F134_RHIMP|nr:hypothetical protein HPB51_010143 [Rhipicephalus microplus]